MADIQSLAPRMQQFRLQGRTVEAMIAERQLETLWAELRAARARDGRGERPERIMRRGAQGRCPCCGFEIWEYDGRWTCRRCLSHGEAASAGR